MLRKLNKWQVEKNSNSKHSMFKKGNADKVTIWQNDQLTRQQAYKNDKLKMASWLNGKLTKWQVEKM